MLIGWRRFLGDNGFPSRKGIRIVCFALAKCWTNKYWTPCASSILIELVEIPRNLMSSSRYDHMALSEVQMQWWNNLLVWEASSEHLQEGVLGTCSDEFLLNNWFLWYHLAKASQMMWGGKLKEQKYFTDRYYTSKWLYLETNEAFWREKWCFFMKQWNRVVV